MAINRIYYAIQQLTLGSGNVPVHGLQTVGLTTNFNLEQVFEYGQLAIYQNIEGIPEIELTANKALDGYPLLYTLGTEAGTGLSPAYVASSPTIAGRQNARVDAKLSIFPDTEVSANGNSIALVTCSGMYVSSVSYTFPVDGNATEDVTFVGNDKIWGGIATGAFPGNDDSPEALSGVVRRQHFSMENSRFPLQIPGIDNDGINQLIGDGSGYSAHINNVTVSCDLGRETILELGSFAPYHRFVTFPVQVSCEIAVTATDGDNINTTEKGYYTGDYTYGGSVSVAADDTPNCTPRFNLRDEKIYLETCEGTKIYLGQKNKLNSVNQTGGDTGGGNMTTTYSFINFNDFIVAHSGGLFYDDVSASGYNP